MIKSKYIGTEFDAGWKVTSAQISGRYGKRNKLKGNSYNYILTRITSDSKCMKSLVVSHVTMVRLARGLTTVEQVEKKKATTQYEDYNNSSSYMFLKE